MTWLEELQATTTDRRTTTLVRQQQQGQHKSNERSYSRTVLVMLLIVSLKKWEFLTYIYIFTLKLVPLILKSVGRFENVGILPTSIQVAMEC